MHINRVFRKGLTVLIMILMAASLLPAQAVSSSIETTENDSEAVRWQDYNGKKIGVLVGPLMEDAAKEHFPDSQHLLYNSYPDCTAALLAGKIDAFLGDEPGMKSLHAEQPDIDYIHDNITENNYSFAFRKDDPESAALCKELNDFLAESHENGTMQELDEIWFGADESRKTVDMSDLTGENGTVRVVTTSTDMPFSYIKDGKNVGYDIDLTVRFCRSRGYALKIGDVDFAGRISAVQSGKYDFSTDMNVTPERQEQVLFSDPTSHGGIVLAVRAEDLSKPAGGGHEGYKTLDELDGKKIGVMTGSIHDSLVSKRLPKAQIVYFNNLADMTPALGAGQIDAFAAPASMATFMKYEDDSLTWPDDHLADASIGFAFPKTESGRALNERFSEFIRALKKDGTLDALTQKWFGADESLRTLDDYTALPDTNGTLRMATTATLMPFTYVKDQTVTGYEIELAALFCAENGCRLQVEQMNFDGILAAVQSGKCDFAGACISATEERKEVVDFSESHYSESIVLVVKSVDSAGTGGSFLSGIRDSFEKTFIRENRWLLFVKGIGTTLMITALSILFGTALGFFLFMICRNGNPVANNITRFCVWLVQGMPAVVLLMILYYIVFGKVSIPGSAVAIVGFTLVFGAAVYSMVKNGVAAVSQGQLEAAYTLGYTNRKAFFRIILPQALPHFMPTYKGEITALIKATAIVGYVAVQDLTKVGDIIRSRTYEAFFPLIAVAVIYFALAGLLTRIVKRAELHIDPRRRTRERIMKGVKTDD